MRPKREEKEVVLNINSFTSNITKKGKGRKILECDSARKKKKDRLKEKRGEGVFQTSKKKNRTKVHFLTNEGGAGPKKKKKKRRDRAFLLI